MPGRIGISQRIIPAVSITVERARIGKGLDDGVGGGEPPLCRIVISRPEVIEAGFGIEFVAGEFVRKTHRSGVAQGLAVRVVCDGFGKVAVAVGRNIQAPEKIRVIIINGPVDYGGDSFSARKDSSLPRRPW